MPFPINPHPYIFKGEYDFEFDTIKDKVDTYLDHAKEEIIRQNAQTHEKDGGTTSVIISKQDPPHNWDCFKKFQENYLYRTIDDVWAQMRFMNLTKQLDTSWINVHPPGAYTEEHHHQNVIIAVAAYLHVPENSGRLLVKNPLQPYKMGEPLVYDYYDEGYDWAPIEVKTNDVLFFPGWMTHKTEKNNSNDDRYVMSMNIIGVHYYAD